MTTTRDQVVEYVREHPGTTISQIAEGLTRPLGTVTYHVRKALRDQDIRKAYDPKNPRLAHYAVTEGSA